MGFFIAMRCFCFGEVLHWGSDHGRKVMLDGKRGKPGAVFHNFNQDYRRIFLGDNQYLLWENGRFEFREYFGE